MVPYGCVLQTKDKILVIDQLEVTYFESNIENPPAPDCHLFDSPILIDLIGTELYEKLLPIAEFVGIDEPIDIMKPWHLGLMLSIRLLLKSGATFGGVDRILWDEARRLGKKISVMEGSEFFRYIDSAPLEESIEALRMIVEKPNASLEQLKELYDAWYRGALSDLNAAFKKMIEVMPFVYRFLFEVRNQKWFPTILKAIQRREKAAFIVGCGHLFHGDYSLENLLKKQGYQLEKLI